MMTRIFLTALFALIATLAFCQPPCNNPTGGFGQIHSNAFCISDTVFIQNFPATPAAGQEVFYLISPQNGPFFDTSSVVLVLDAPVDELLFAPPLEKGVSYNLAKVLATRNTDGTINFDDPCFNLDHQDWFVFYDVADLVIQGDTILRCFPANNALTIDGQFQQATTTWTFPDGTTRRGVSVVINEPGIHTVTVEVGGCVQSASVNVTADLSLPLLESVIIENTTCSGTNDGSISVEYDDPTSGPLAYSWSNGSVIQNQTDLSPGTYCVTVVTPPGCLTSDCFDVLSATDLLVEVTYDSLACSIQPVVTILGGVAPYTYVLNGIDYPILPQLSPGLYILEVVDANGCTQTVTIVFDSSPNACANITGRVAYDANQDCFVDANEMSIGSIPILATETTTGQVYYGISATDGTYELFLNPGVYSVTTGTLDPNYITCGVPAVVDLPTVNDQGTADFPLDALLFCAQMEVEITTPFLRRCFSNNRYFVQVQNTGLDTARNVSVEVILDEFFNFDSASIAPIMVTGDTLLFALADFMPGEQSSFTIYGTLDCQEVTLGQTHCTTAQVYPDSICEATPQNWSGASLEVVASCFGDSIAFIIQNTGDQAMLESRNYIVVEDGIMFMQGSTGMLNPDEQLRLVVPATGATWLIQVDQINNHPTSNTPVAFIEGCTVNNQFSTGFINQFPLGEEDPTFAIDCTPNQGAYDPNDKQGFPVGYGAERYIEPGTTIDYLIRFQNTGTDTAFTVVIVDTLQPTLDPRTIKPGASSHAYEFSLSGNGIATFTYTNIMLPDSNVNEPASNGFVAFQIDHRADLPLETIVENTAEIYFDFNEAIVTNTTHHQLGKSFITVGLWEPIRPQYQVSVFPQPVGDQVTIAVLGASLNTDYRLHIYNGVGQLLTQKRMLNGAATLPASELLGSYFFFTIRDDQGQLVGNGKLLKQ